MRLGIRIIAVFLAVASVGYVASDAVAQSRKDSRARARAHMENLELFGMVYERLMRNYVDELDPEEMIQVAIDAMLEELDPHSQLLTEQVYDDLMTNTQGEFGGLGIQIVVRDGYPTVVSPIDGTPAFRLGIRGGDQIVEIEGESTEGWRSSQAVEHLRGPKGSEVRIGIKRPGRELILPFTIVRDIIKVESVPHAFMLDEEEGIGYLRVTNFSRTTRREIEEKLDVLDSQGLQSLIIDLRFNPGGLLQSATDVSELFLDKGELIVYTKGRLAQQNMRYYASSTAGRRWGDRPLVVLVNGSSASASEILAGAIQDHDMGLVVGQPSFGKGSVQTVFEISPTKALKLTTAKYFTPAGRSIHRDRTRDGEIIEEEGIDLVETTSDDVESGEPETYETDAGRKVYGGGGITPDAEIEPTLLTDFAVVLERDATFFHFINEWLIDHEDPGLGFEVDDEMFAAFMKLTETREDLPGFFEDFELEMSSELFSENREYVTEGIQREMARRNHGNSAAYRVGIERDGQVWKVVDLLRKNKTRAELFAAAEEMEKQRLAELEAEAMAELEAEESEEAVSNR